jgi:hypothetical protein
MQIHLFERTSQKPMVRQMGNHNLSLCMLALEELSKSYIAANTARRLFEAAMQKADKRPQRDEAAVTAAGEEDLSIDMETSTLHKWPDGCWTSTADILADVWTPWNGSVVTQ